MSKAISIRINDDMLEELENLAETTERSRTFLISEAIRTYLDEYGDYRIALDRLLDKNDDIIAGSELRSRLGLQGLL